MNFMPFFVFPKMNFALIECNIAVASLKGRQKGADLSGRTYFTDGMEGAARRRLLATTQTELMAMQAAASIGLSRNPQTG